MESGEMKKNLYKSIRRFLCFALALTMVLAPAAGVFAAEEDLAESGSEVSAASETAVQEAPPAQDAPAAADSVSATADTPAPADMQDTDPAADAVAETADVKVEEPAEKTESFEQPAAESSAKDSAGSSAANTITIGDTSFNSDDEESSHWDGSKGWINVAGQYVAMVDYDGSDAEISADGGILTLAVAGVNRIGALRGDCSFQIVGSGIVLIDSIAIEDGNGVTLHPNTAIDNALYKECSAAVFLKQDNGTYKLMNGETAGILDEVYNLDDVKLIIPAGSKLVLSALGVRTETWWNDDAEEQEDVTLYTEDLPYDANIPNHNSGQVEIKGYAASVVLGENSTLTIEDGASVVLKTVNTGAMIQGRSSLEAELIVKGLLTVKGVLEGGYVDVSNSGTVKGNGTIHSASIDLEPNGYISALPDLSGRLLTLDDCRLTIKGDDRSLNTPLIKDSTIYLKGSRINIPTLKATGTCYLGVEVMDGGILGQLTNSSTVGNILMDQGSDLNIVCNEHPYVAYGNNDVPRYVEDCYLTISGSITGGAVNVLAGCVEYTGPGTGVIPAVPDPEDMGYASRVYYDTNNITAWSLFPLNMTRDKASDMADDDEITVMALTVMDSLISQKVLAREWLATRMELEPLSREEYPSFESVQDLLDIYKDKYGLVFGNNSEATAYTAVELIYSDLGRRRIFLVDDIRNQEFNTEDVIMIRILSCYGMGGQAGSAASHTSATLTGSGIIGGNGSGSVKAGDGKVVYGVASITDPVTPVEPDNKDDDNGNGNGNNSNSSGSINSSSNSIITTVNNSTNNTNTAKIVTATAVKTSDLVVTVSLHEPLPEKAAGAKAETPQVWRLDVTKAGAAVTDLSGTPVKVTFPFTVPEAWGDAAKIAEGNLYAVFTDEEGVLTAYAAQYDPETGEVTFEAEQTGDFVIVQFAYDKEPFTEDFYKALAELKDVKDFIAVLKEEKEKL